MHRRKGGSKPNVLATMFLVALGAYQGACLSSSGGADASIVDARRNDTAAAHGDSSFAIDLPPTGNCEPFTNLGCGAGEKCTALQQSDGTLAWGCDAVGSKGEGDACSQVMVSSGAATVQIDDDCADGLACFSTQVGASPSCHRMCKSDGTQVCPNAEVCSLVAPGIAPVEFCRATGSCSPITQTGCSAGQACYWSSSGALCAAVGSGPVGEPCVNANDCVPGATCVALSSSRCVVFCSTEGTPGCPSGETCAALSGNASAANVGYCK
jgi:hypothetical protein